MTMTQQLNLPESKVSAQNTNHISIQPDIVIAFDGGCLPANGRHGAGAKYGSYRVLLKDAVVCEQQCVMFGHGTNNEAEFQALESALKESCDALTAQGHTLGTMSVHVISDSMILLSRLRNNKIHKKPKYVEASTRMYRCAEACLVWLRKFKVFTVEWQPRQRNVERFGH